MSNEPQLFWTATQAEDRKADYIVNSVRNGSSDFGHNLKTAPTQGILTWPPAYQVSRFEAVAFVIGLIRLFCGYYSLSSTWILPAYNNINLGVLILCLASNSNCLGIRKRDTSAKNFQILQCHFVKL